MVSKLTELQPAAVAADATLKDQPAGFSFLLQMSRTITLADIAAVEGALQYSRWKRAQDGSILRVPATGDFSVWLLRS